jgi:hypothetical protein
MVKNEDEEIFEALPGAVKNIIIEQLQKVQVSHDDIREALLGSRDMIARTKKITDNYARAFEPRVVVVDEPDVEVDTMTGPYIVVCNPEEL